jgi:hypothetical protein
MDEPPAVPDKFHSNGICTVGTRTARSDSVRRTASHAHNQISLPTTTEQGVCMKVAINASFLAAITVLLTACAGSSAVKYHFPAKKEDPGYRFVIPRTIVKVSLTPPAADHTSQDAALSLTPVPVNYDRDAKPLPVYSVTDDTGGWSLFSTSITNVKYADTLIIQSIGTQVTDNRKDAIDTVVAIAGIAGAFASDNGCSEKSPMHPFVVDELLKSSEAPVPAPDNDCWGYRIADVKDIDPDSQFPIQATGTPSLPLEANTSWFPYPACKQVKISVVPCKRDGGNPAVCTPVANGPHYDGTVSVADGTNFRRVALPQKGKVEMHGDFCVADTTSDASPLSSDWSLVTQAIKDVKDLKKK